MTEEEAKKFPCIRPSSAALLENGPCIGSRCGMAWRWDIEASETRNRPIADGAPEGDGWVMRWKPSLGDTHVTWHRTEHGYCGFGGKP